MQPAMLVVKTKSAKMICVSGFNSTADSTPTGDKGNASINSLSKRRRGIFQDDSEEDQSIW